MHRKHITLAIALITTAAIAGAQDDPVRTTAPVRIQSVPSAKAVPARRSNAVVYGTQATPYAVTASGFFDPTKVSGP